MSEDDRHQHYTTDRRPSDKTDTVGKRIKNKYTGKNYHPVIGIRRYVSLGFIIFCEDTV